MIQSTHRSSRLRFILGAATLIFIAESCGGGDGGTSPTPSTPSLSTVSVALSASSVNVGQTVVATASGLDQNGASIALGTITWTTSPASIASVNASGVVTGIAPGQVTVMANVGGKQGQSSLTVVSPPTLTTVNVTLSASTISVGQTVNASATGSDQNGNPIALGTVTWSTSPTAIASVNSSGLVTGVAAGQAAVIASVGGKQGQRTLSVTAAVPASISFSPTSVTVDVGQTAQVTATVKDAVGNVLADKIVAWLTSDGSIAGGTTNGNTATIQGVAAGSATVTASVDGVSGNVPVTVRPTAPKPVATVVISPGTASIAIGTSVPLVATLRDAQGTVLTGRAISWTTSNVAIANGTVSGNLAIVRGISAGTATISATSEGIVGSTLVTVTVGGTGEIALNCAGVAGGQVYATDGQYLGRLTNRFDSQSILNTFGSYGSQFSSTSMFNTFGSYGSQFASLSAYNPFTSTPPQLYVSGQFAAYVSKNTVKIPRYDPDALRSCVFP